VFTADCGDNRKGTYNGNIKKLRKKNESSFQQYTTLAAFEPR